MQEGLDICNAWSEEYKIPISKGKNEALLWYNYKKVPTPTLFVGKDMVIFNQDKGLPVRLLGVMLDAKMSFTDHIAKLKKAHAETINSMRKLSGSSWGPSARDLRGVYIAFSRSKLEYAAAAWAP